MPVDPNIGVNSIYTELHGARLTITPSTLDLGDRLNFTRQNGISGDYSSDGVLYLSGTASVSQYEQALQSVTFSTTSINTTARDITVVAFDDSGSGDSNTAIETVDLVAPFLVKPSGVTATFTLGGSSAVAVDPNVTVSFPYYMLSATVSILDGTLQAGDTLNFTNQNNITGHYDSATGVLTLTGDDTPANYQAALQSVTFSTTSTSTNARAMTFDAFDGFLVSNFAFEQVNILSGAVPFQVLHPFTDANGDGANSYAGLTLVGSKLYGTTEYGGSNGDGTVFSMNTDGSGTTVLHSFSGASTDGKNPVAGLTFVPLIGSYLFGTTAGGGAYGDGTLFMIDTVGNDFQIVHSFSGDGDDPAAGLTLVGDILYGTTEHGGSGDHGTVFSFDLVHSAYTVLHRFSGTDGANPEANLTLDGSRLFGTTYAGGAVGYGTVFSINTLNDPNNTDFQPVHSFGWSSSGASPAAGLTLVGDTLFGTTEYGGISGNSSLDSVDNYQGDGTLFEVGPSGAFFTLHSFSGGSFDGEFPRADLTLVGSTLFGTTSAGGTFGIQGYGTVFSINTDGGGYQRLYSFTNGADGASPSAGLTLVGSTLYGTTDDGYGAVFSLADLSVIPSRTPKKFIEGGSAAAVDPTLAVTTTGYRYLSGATVTINNYQPGDALHFTNFTNSSNIIGSYAGGVLTLAGTTSPANYQAALQSITFSTISTNTTARTISIQAEDGSLNSNVAAELVAVYPPPVVSTLISFDGWNGQQPAAALTLVGSALFGTTSVGGPYDDGILFSIHTDGTGYQFLHTFSGGTDGENPDATLTLVGSTLFGTTAGGGTHGDGTIFSIQTDGSGYQVLYSFLGGGDPTAGLTLVGSTFYGTTQYGGLFGFGTVFSIQTDGSGFQVVHSFSGTDGENPNADLTLVGSTLFGTTSYGGPEGGTVFSINTENDDFNVVHWFGVGIDDAMNPFAGLTLVGSTLFGTTEQGGDGSAGTVFSMNADGSNYQTLYSFDGFGGPVNDGMSPAADLILVGSTLFGTTLYDGSGFGTVFSLSAALSGFAVKTSGSTSQTFTLGSSAVAVDSGVTVSSNDTDLTGASMTITNFQSGDALNYTPIGGIAIASNTAGVLTLTGSATPAEYQAALQSVTFSTTSFTQGLRTIDIVADDSAALPTTSNPAVAIVNVAIPAPVVTASGATNTFTLGGMAVPIDSGVTVTAYLNLENEATVTINNYQSGDTLQFTNQNGTIVSNSAGVLDLTGSATPAQYQAALQAVTFSTTSTNTTARSISIGTQDGSLHSNLAAEQVYVVTPQISVSGNSQPIADGSTMTSTTNDTAFGSTLLNTSLSETYTITNSGTAPLTVGNVSIGESAKLGVTVGGAMLVRGIGVGLAIMPAMTAAWIKFRTAMSGIVETGK